MTRYWMTVEFDSDTDPATWEPDEKLIIWGYKIINIQEFKDEH